MAQNLDEILASLGGMQPGPHQPEGDPGAVPLTQLGLDRPIGESFPADVNSQQGAGSGSSLTPAANITGVGQVHVGGNHPDSSGGPEQLPLVDGVDRLTAGGNKDANRPS